MSAKRYTFDAGLELKDAGLVAASAAAQVNSAARVLDLGSGLVEGDIVLDVSALEIASKDEVYDIIAQLSPDADFGTAGNIVERCALNLSAKEVKRSDCDKDDTIGRHILPFNNEHKDMLYRYARLYTVVAGTIATGINYSAFLAKK
ncbi:MAG: hypothetical protein ABFD91_02870 [Anaerohalosphaeraceae bacterium]